MSQADISQLRIGFESDGNGQLVSIYDARLTEAKIVCWLSNNGDSGRPANTSSGFTQIDVSCFGYRLWVDHQTMLVYREPRTSASATSAALYLAESRDQRLGWLLQLLPAKLSTSWHHHERRHEVVFNLAGSCRLGVDPSKAEQSITRRHVVLPPGTKHYLVAGLTAAINLLVITGHPEPLSWQDHHYHDQ